MLPCCSLLAACQSLLATFLCRWFLVSTIGQFTKLKDEKGGTLLATRRRECCGCGQKKPIAFESSAPRGGQGVSSPDIDSASKVSTVVTSRTLSSPIVILLSSSLAPILLCIPPPSLFLCFHFINPTDFCATKCFLVSVVPEHHLRV